MPSIELLLDEQTDSRIREEWRLLSEAGIPSQHDHRGESNAPHITAIFTTTPLTGSLVAPPGPARLGGVLLFPGRRGVVLARSVVPNVELLAWQRDLRAMLPTDATVDPHCEPGAWSPHVTLARAIPAHQLGEAVALLARDEREVDFTGVRLWDAATATVTQLS